MTGFFIFVAGVLVGACVGVVVAGMLRTAKEDLHTTVNIFERDTNA